MRVRISANPILKYMSTDGRDTNPNINHKHNIPICHLSLKLLIQIQIPSCHEVSFVSIFQHCQNNTKEGTERIIEKGQVFQEKLSSTNKIKIIIYCFMNLTIKYNWFVCTILTFHPIHFDIGCKFLLVVSKCLIIHFIIVIITRNFSFTLSIFSGIGYFR